MFFLSVSLWNNPNSILRLKTASRRHTFSRLHVFRKRSLERKKKWKLRKKWSCTSLWSRRTNVANQTRSERLAQPQGWAFIRTIFFYTGSAIIYIIFSMSLCLKCKFHPYIADSWAPTAAFWWNKGEPSIDILEDSFADSISKWMWAISNGYWCV